MYTKKEICELYLRAFAVEQLNMKPPIKLEDIPEDSSITSSKAAVCMEYLGLLKNPDIISYAASRGGTLLLSTNERGDAEVVSFRELIESLPNEI